MAGSSEVLLQALENIRASAQVVKSAQLEETSKDAAQREESSIKAEAQKVDLAEKKASNHRVGDIHWMRKVGLIALFVLVLIWLGMICAFLFLSGYNEPSLSLLWMDFEYENMPVLKLSDPVLIALIGSTTVNVVGLFYVAARWLYSSPGGGKVAG